MCCDVRYENGLIRSPDRSVGFCWGSESSTFIIGVFFMMLLLLLLLVVYLMVVCLV